MVTNILEKFNNALKVVNIVSYSLTVEIIRGRISHARMVLDTV